MAFGIGPKKDQEVTPPSENDGTEVKAEPPKVQAKPVPGMATRMAGEKKYFIDQLDPFLPIELVGGSLPYVPGMEDEAVWNAASQSCATEKVHYVYSIEDNKVWYLACPSTVMVSNPDSWCPLAAALPGNSEFWDKETVYIYEKDGAAGALRWDQETGRMQIFLGASRTILPRIQSMDANFITINDQLADIVPWRNKQLKTEQLSRATARLLLISGVVVSLILMAFIAAQYVMINFLDRNLEKVKEQTEQASLKLLSDAKDLSKNDVLDYTIRIQQLLDDLTKIDGTLVRFEVSKGKMEWEALVPAAYSTGIMSVRGKAQPEIEKDGRVRVKGTR
ncbi:MAG: hypothetical protein PHX61_04330 [Alphaproteobacteria bacterium]|nr:hypothetical protein [Alphaproteobacteria bacterium]OIN86296.1 MAG: hypothetical protein AUJ12_06565 [Alphaproteobacteria bacterium CG1_02_46_17]